MLTIHVGNFDAGGASGVQPSTVRINNYLTPATVSAIPSWPGFSGTVLELTIAKRDFVLYFPVLWTSHMRYVGVGAILYSGAFLSATGQFELLPNTAGDANADCRVDVGDVVCLIHYLFRDGPEPAPWEPADADGSGEITIVDAVYLLDYIFSEGPPPTHVSYR
jgi:hypothetical protein